MRQRRAFTWGLSVASVLGSLGILAFGCSAETVSRSNSGDNCLVEPETCDGVDNDCDGDVDEDCDCLPQATQGCYSGSADSSGKGLCKGGTQTCNEDGLWGACLGEVLPAPGDVCDGLDNNCDGMVDEGCACSPPGPETTQPCYTGDPSTMGVGACTAGTQTCLANGTWSSVCKDEVKPKAEVCDDADNDCNNAVDDKGMTTCGVGACQVTVVTCTDGQATACEPLLPSKEVCDGTDNDCDQLTDETDPDNGKACASAMPGVCASGTYACESGVKVCNPAVLPSAEKCDGLDNDCNGATDDNIAGTGGFCSSGFPGVCDQGMISCQNGVVDCFPIVAASPEVCDGLDNDCDGSADEGNPGGSGACDTGLVGACQAGTLNCIGGSITCTQNTQPKAETCDGVDNNCDGSVDEGNPGAGASCGCAGTTSCTNGALVCGGGITTYFQEDFANNSKGWTLGTTWQIGPAVSCVGCTSGNPDPGQDHTPTADNGLAGVIIGGPAPTAVHDFYWLESPAFNTANAQGSVYLQFWRFLNSDYTSFMQNKVQVYNGSAWVDLPYGTTGGSPGVRDTVWTNHGVPAGAPLNPTSSAEYPTQFDLTPYKNANMRIRFGHNIGGSGAFTMGSWSVDDVLVASAICP